MAPGDGPWIGSAGCRGSGARSPPARRHAVVDSARRTRPRGGRNGQVDSVPATPPAREHGLDALRVFAFALLIVYHSCLAYVPWPWLINDPGGGRALEFILLGINRWRLPLVFFVTG